MTSHELAKKLMEGPDLVVVSYGGDEMTPKEISSLEEEEDLIELKDGSFSHNPHILIL